MRALWIALLRWLVTDCPLCGGRSRLAQLCQGCYADVFEQRQHRPLCTGCANDLSQGGYFKRQQHLLDESTSGVVRALCRICERVSQPTHGIVCALDDRFPTALMLERFVDRRSDLTLAPVLAALMWQACRLWFDQSPTPSLWPDCWLAMPAAASRLKRCRCNPSQELARALARLTGIERKTRWLSCSSKPDVPEHWWAHPGVTGRTVGLVLDRLEQPEVVMAAAHCLRSAGACRVIVVCAAKGASLWQNGDHVSCDTC